MSTRGLIRLAVLALLVAAAGALAFVPGAGEGFAMLVPAFALLFPLVAGRYPGEEAIDRLRGLRSVPRPRRRVVAVLARGGRPASALVRGGTLLGAHLAVRPPPAPG